MTEDARHELDDGPAVPSLLAGARPHAERESSTRLIVDDEEAIPPSAVRPSTRAAASPSPVGEAAAPTVTLQSQGARRFFELDGVRYECRPVRKVTPKPAGHRPRGLAACSPEKRAEIAAKGGRASAKSDNAGRWTSDRAKEAGRKGGLAKARKSTRDLGAAAE